jgi:hypothetical protein
MIFEDGPPAGEVPRDFRFSVRLPDEYRVNAPSFEAAAADRSELLGGGGLLSSRWDWVVEKSRELDLAAWLALPTSIRPRPCSRAERTTG